MVGSRHVAASNRPVTVCNGPVRIRALAIVCAMAVSAGTLLQGGAAGATPPEAQLPGTNPVDITPRVQDGRVQSTSGSATWWSWGDPTTVLDTTTGTSMHRTGLFAFDATTGTVSKTFRPVLTASPGKTPEVDVVVPSADGSEVYVGGVFGAINGSGPARFQALRLSDGTRSSTFKNGSFSSRVYDAALTHNALYVSGSFTSVDGKARQGLASLDPETGKVTRKVRLRSREPRRGSGRPPSARST